MIATTSAVQHPGDEPVFPAQALGELSDELTRALDFELWALTFRGDLDDALDGALLRSVLAGTPTLSGGLVSFASY